jgi:hypothetical protein
VPDPRLDLARLGNAAGVVSLLLAGIGVLRPRALARAGGVVDADGPAVPLLVRFVAARQTALGLALLTRRPLDMHRAAGLFLPVTAVDAAAVLAARRSGVLHRRSAVMSLAVLATNAWVHRRTRP